MTNNFGDFFNAFDDEIKVNWSNISETELNAMLQKLDKQDVEKIFTDLHSAISSNNKKKAIVKVTLQILSVAAKLGMKVV